MLIYGRTAYVTRSKVTYEFEIWRTDSHIHIQSTALRLCLGCPKTIPMKAVEIQLNIEPEYELSI